MSQSSNRSVLLGAAFLMATSAIGPGFLTQTATFTQTLLASFGFVILLSILLDIGAQLNIWRIIAVSEQRAQDIANKVLPGAGYLLALLIVMGGLALNATYTVSAIMIKPMIWANRSITLPASRNRKMPMAIRPLIIAPVSGERPVRMFKPKPAPPTLPILKASPPITIKSANK